ncbi:MAG: polyprenyl synthetase family protein [Bacteroidota bacterium]
MYNYSDIHKILIKEIETLDLNGKPFELYEPIRYILSLGGKRIRPVLTLLACNIYDDYIEKAINPAIGIEIFHNFTLVHDDIMDDASMRRNHPTIHEKWDTNVAVLSGDAMMIKSYEFFFELEKDVQIKVLKIFNTTALEVCEGQQYDMNFENCNHVTVNEYLEMIRLKTAVLLAASLKIGGIIGGANDVDAYCLYNFGENLGLAFQLKDDLLDVFGDEKKIGKKIGGDIVSNKKTFLFISALQCANKTQKQTLINWLSKKNFDKQEKIDVFRNVYNDLKIKEIVEERIIDFKKKAIINLNTLSVDKRKLIPLLELFELIMNREY